MSQQVEANTRTFEAGGALTQYARVKLNGSNKLAVCDAGDIGLGVLQRAALASGDMVPVKLWRSSGTMQMIAATSFSQEALLYGAASGLVDDVVNGNPIGYALQAATALNDVVEVALVSARAVVSSATALDDVDITLGTGSDVVQLFSTADASNHAFVVGLDNTSQQMHITDAGAKATDWARSAGTHPEVAIHSNTTPATDYLSIGNHDGTTATVDVVGGTTLNFDIAGTTAVDIAAGQLGIPVDDGFLSLGASDDFQILFGDSDASNHAGVIAIDNTSQQLHITDVGAKATDWNRSAGTHPELSIHSNTTPATDYLAIGNHDGTTAYIDVVGGTTLSLKIAGTEYASVVATGLSVGTYVAAGSVAGTDHITIKSTGTAPTGTGANVGHLYADYETDDDELFWLAGTVGTATQLTT